jgi:hypothetical protein
MRFLLSSSLLLAAPAFAQQFPEVEPNNTSATAQVVALGTQINASLTAGDNDWYTFTTAGGYHTISGGNSGDTRYYLWDATATTLLAFNDDTRGLSSDVSMNLAAGTYLLQVTGYAAGTTGNYSVDISAATPTKAYTSAEVEPNNTVGTANPIADGAQVTGTLVHGLVASDAAAAGSTTTVIQATTPLVAGAHVGQLVRMTSGAAAGYWGTVTANTATALTIAQALPIAPLALDTFNIETPDLDVYQLTLTAPRSMVAFQICEGDAPAGFGHRYEIWDAAGALLIPVTTYGTNGADSGTYSGRTVQQIRCLPAGTYHIVVRTRPGSANQGGGPLAAFYPYQGNYRLEVKARGMDIIGLPVTENAEPNDTVATATPIATGQQGLGNLSISTGADVTDLWGPINITVPSLLQFQTGNGAAPAIIDTTVGLRQFDPVTNTLGAATNVTSGNTLEPAGTSHARGTFTFLLPGTIYYLEVRSPLATTSGNYILQISEITGTAYSVGNFATATANAAGCGTAGVPAITRPFATNPEQPTIGQTFAVQATNLNGLGNLGLMVTGFAQILPTPLDLTPFGAPGCVLNVTPDVIEVLIGNGSGVADYVLPIPGNNALKGTVLFQQPCKWDFVTPINALGIQPGGWARYIIGDRNF